MGCCVSRKDSKLLKLCKERAEMIKDARDFQCSLAFAHMTYFQSLQDAENEFSNFLNESLLLYEDLPFDTTCDHLKKQLTHSEPSGNSDNAKDEEVDEDDVKSSTSCVIGGSTLSDFQSTNNRRKVINSTEAINSKTCSEGVSDNVLRQQQAAASKRPEHSSIPSPKGVIAQHSSTCFEGVMDNFLYQQQVTDDLSNRSVTSVNNNKASVDGQNAFPHTNWSFYPRENEANRTYLTAFPPHYLWDHQTQRHPHNDISLLDYLNPFISVENHYNRVFYDKDLHGVREREGIPELEDISDDEISSEEYSELNEDSDECYLEAIHKHNKNKVMLDQQMNKENEKIEKLDQTDLDNRSNNRTTMIERLKADKRQEAYIQKGAENLETQERENECTKIDETVAEVTSEAFVHSSTDIKEAYNKIKNEFDNINMHGNYVSHMLGTDKLVHRPCIALFKGFPCCKSHKGSGIALSSKRGMSRRPSYRILKRKNGGSENNQNTNSSSCNLLLTLEKLCIWEHKLYEGVKNEEKLRVTFDKEWRKLKRLDDQGAESVKIEVRHLSLRKLTPGIHLFISKLNSIAQRINMLRDEELQPQLCELIHRLQQMFKVSFEGHKKQIQLMMEATPMLEVSCMTYNSSVRVIKKLEAEILKLGTSFSDWIRTHKAFVKLLNNWLIKCHLGELEKTTNEFSSSCASLEAPIVVVICHDWLSAIEKASDIEVIGAINSFTVLLHQLRILLLKEKQKRLKIQNYSRRHKKKLESFHRESLDRGVVHDQVESLLCEVQATESIEVKDLTLQTMYMSLILTRKRLNEAKAKHEDIMKQANDTVKLICKSGFLPILKALESFNLEMFIAFQQVRISGEGGTQ